MDELLSWFRELPCRLGLHRWLRDGCGRHHWLCCDRCSIMRPYSAFQARLACFVYGHAWEERQDFFDVCACCRKLGQAGV